MNPPVNINQQDGNGVTPLYHAVIRNLHDVASELLQHGAEIGPEPHWKRPDWCPTDEMKRLMRHHRQLEPPRAERFPWWPWGLRP
jgi:hypothetical protein